jgi:hypothetical protein
MPGFDIEEVLSRAVSDGIDKVRSNAAETSWL